MVTLGVGFILGGECKDPISGGLNCGVDSGALADVRTGIKTLVGGRGADVICGNNGNDLLVGDGYTMLGGQDDDTLGSVAGADSLLRNKRATP